MVQQVSAQMQGQLLIVIKDIVCTVSILHGYLRFHIVNHHWLLWKNCHPGDIWNCSGAVNRQQNLRRQDRKCGLRSNNK